MADETNRSDAQKVGQHEDILARIDKGFKDVLTVLSKLGTGSQVVIQLDTTVQERILDIVREIRRNQAGAGGLTPAEESALAEKLDAASGPLQVAVEGNQP